jgi:pimeloyl-ACP methyl ester carboxylesterase
LPYFDNEGVKIYYEIEGSGPDLMMIHGFAASIEVNWKLTNWVKTLKDENRMIMMDCRGHGKSDKPKETAQYGVKMVEDISKLMDHLSIEKANFFGYSMGSRLTLELLLREPQRVNCAILGGFGLPNPGEKYTNLSLKDIVSALRSDSMDQVKGFIGKEFRKFAESTGADLPALAAIMESQLLVSIEGFNSRAKMRATLRKIKVPLMSVVGSNDFLIQGDKTLFAQLVPDACHFQIQGRDHLTVVPDPKFHAVVRAFLNYVNKK